LSNKEDVKNLLQSKAQLEKQISSLEGELKHLRLLLEVVNKFLAEKSFKVASVPKEQPEAPKAPAPTVKRETPKPTAPTPPPPTPPTQTVQVQKIPLKTANGIPLATLYVTEGEIKTVPSEKVKFNINTPPFNQFLISKVLANIAAQDREAAIAGQIEPDDIMTYRVIQDNDILKELIVRNYRDKKRVAELRNSIRWTLEKMYEKMML
jgi:hypothetical protein